MSILAQGARAFGIDLTPAQLDRFEFYYRQLVDWNARGNLTSITEYNQVQTKHFLDSLSVALALPRPFETALEGKTLIDVGTGAGFPGLPLAIALPHLQVTLLEATGKKAIFVTQLGRAVGLENIETLKGRAEELGQNEQYRENFDFATGRAVAELRTLVEYTLPLLRIGGLLIAQKSVQVYSELALADRAISELGGHFRELIPVELPGILEKHHLIIVDKVAATPAKYPRRPGIPEKRPL